MKKENIIGIECVLATLCKGASVDQQNNNLSIFNVIEQISLTPPKDIPKTEWGKIKVVPVDYQLVALWRATKGLMPREFNVQLELIDPEGAKTQTGSHSVKIAEPKMRLRTLLQITALKFSTQGEYWIVIKAKLPNEKDFVEYFRVPLEVKIPGKS